MHSSICVLFFVLQLFIISVKCGPLPSTEAANDELVKDEDYDVSKIAMDVQDGVKLVGGKGPVELIISGKPLIVSVDVKECVGKVLFCYPSSKAYEVAKQLCSKWPGFCGFQLIGTNNDITFTTSPYKKDDLEECLNDIEMVWSTATFCKGATGSSCDAAISDNNAPIKIHVESAQCSVIIKNAKIYYPPTTLPPSTIPPPTLLPGPSNNNTTKDEKTSEASSETWIWIILAVGLALIVIGIIAGILLCWYKKWCFFEKKKTAEASPPRVGPIVTTTVEKVVVSAKSKKEKPKPPKLVVEVPSKEPSKKHSPTLSLAPTPPTSKSIKKPKEKKGASPAKKPKTPAVAAKKESNGKKADRVSPGKKSKKEKPKISVAAPAGVRKESNEKKTGRVSPGKKTKESSTQSYSPPFCLAPIHPPSPPKEPLVPGYIVHTNRKPGQKGQYANSLELPTYSGGKLVPPKITAAEIQKAKMEEWEKERQLWKELKEKNNS